MHQCKAIFVTCMDFRLQSAYLQFAKDNDLVDNYDLFSLAGTQKSFIDEETRAIALKQVELSSRLHGINEVYLFAHWDCGAYGGNEAFANEHEQRNTYVMDLQKAQSMINEKFPKLQVKGFLANWNNEQKICFEQIF